MSVTWHTDAPDCEKVEYPQIHNADAGVVLSILGYYEFSDWDEITSFRQRCIRAIAVLDGKARAGYGFYMMMGVEVIRTRVHTLMMFAVSESARGAKLVSWG